MASTRQTATVDDMTGLSDSEKRFDLIRGEDGEIAAGIIARIWAHATENELGRVYSSETGFILSREPDTIPAPDAAFIRGDRVPGRSPGSYEIAPDLVAEVVSPGDSANYVTTKVMGCLDSGVRTIWVVDPPGQTVTVYLQDRSARLLSDQDALDGGDVLPGFSIPVLQIFE